MHTLSYHKTSHIDIPHPPGHKPIYLQGKQLLVETRPQFFIHKIFFFSPTINPHSHQKAGIILIPQTKASKEDPPFLSCGFFPQQVTDPEYAQIFLSLEATCSYRKESTMKIRSFCVLFAQIFFSPVDFRRLDGNQQSREIISKNRGHMHTPKDMTFSWRVCLSSLSWLATTKVLKRKHLC